MKQLGFRTTFAQFPEAVAALTDRYKRSDRLGGWPSTPRVCAGLSSSLSARKACSSLPNVSQTKHLPSYAPTLPEPQRLPGSLQPPQPLALPPQSSCARLPSPLGPQSPGPPNPLPTHLAPIMLWAGQLSLSRGLPACCPLTPGDPAPTALGALAGGPCSASHLQSPLQMAACPSVQQQ